uniref:Type I polyketide synthase-like protein KB1008 n=1 Tax=Karenia brevis TaxID=156230 RepID=A7KH54_KARBR|nr:type I polyketide synthase-like protein KB1008 [Karenia brevis]
MALIKVKYGENEADIMKGGSPEEDCSLIEFCLKTKGYCCIGDAVDEASMQKARDEILDLEGLGKLKVPNSLVQDGLLGPDGSAQIAEMEITSFTEDAIAPEGEELRKIDLMMWSLSKSVILCQESLGFEGTSRSTAFIHQSGDTGEEMELTDLEADKWSSIFLRRKVAILVFLGPDSGTLELQPYDEDANPSEITTYPGLVVLLRTDQLSFKHESTGVTSCISSFIMQDSILRMDKAVREVHMTPAAEAIEKWIENRLMEMKAEEDEETVWGEDTPRGFVLAMNHACTKVAHTVIRGASFRMPVSWHMHRNFAGYLGGSDVVTEVPSMRWDHSAIYDPNPMGWKTPGHPTTHCRHGSYVDGVEFFDNKLFGLSPAEAKGMDPSQRCLLECAYGALHSSGIRKSKMMNSTTGIYLGISFSEWDYTERDKDPLLAQQVVIEAICCGRVSFCLGLKGACLSIDTECCSALTSVANASEAVALKGRGRYQEHSIGAAVYLQLAKAYWAIWSAAGILSGKGRCFTWDQSAEGGVRSDGLGALVVKRAIDIVDGEVIQDEPDHFGVIYGAGMVHSGQMATLHAPNSISIQESLRESVRRGDIQAFDVDAVECHGDANLLCDAVEVAAINKGLRDGNSYEMLALTAGKTNVGNAKEAAGLYQIMKVICAARMGTMPGNQHLCQLNPHLDLEDTSVHLLTEPLEFRLKSCFQHAFARGMGGTNTSLLFHGAVNETLRPPPKPCPEELRPKLTYWPAGGGSLDDTGYARRAYCISGTWNGWSLDQKMQEEEEGCFAATVVLGENRWEQFRILIDGDPDRALHPNRYKAPKGTLVFGPEPVEDDSSWLIDGRQQYTTFERNNEDGSAQYDFLEYSSGDQGVAGTEYRVRLYIAGKWRTVSWTKLESTKELTDSDRGTYFILGDWDNYLMSMGIEMEADASKPGVFTAELPRTHRNGARFLIVRNKDPTQMIYPLQVDAGMEAPVVGPDDILYDTQWALPGSKTLKVTLAMTTEGTKDVKKVTWEAV